MSFKYFIFAFLCLLYPLHSNSDTDVAAQGVSGNELTVVVPPLLTDSWGGGSPYNDLCPLGKDGKRCTAGCSSVAMAQVMRYWQWPDHGIGQHSYIATLDGNPETTIELSANFGQTTYQWNQMLDSYTGNNITEQQKEAVATLVYQAGVSQDMQYGVNGSANALNWIEGLRRYFRFYGEQLRGRTDNEYAAIIRKELEAGRPVIFHGESEDGRRTHTFVCDGYAEGDYFHFNFGYRGSLNGYYQLADLRPADGYDFRFNHWIVCGLKPYRGEMPTGTVELTVTEPGTLQQLVDESAAPFASSLKVSGPVNGADLLVLRKLAGADENNLRTGGILEDLDLSEAIFSPSEDVYWQRETEDVMTTSTITRQDELPENSFRYTKLRRFVLPTSVSAVGSMAFFACYNLEEIVFNEHITTIGPSAFRNTGLREALIPDYVTAIEQWAFGDNSQLTKVHIGSHVARINYSAFNRCDAIQLVESDIAQPFYIQSNVFSETVYTNATLKVPAGTESLYRYTQWWQKFAHIEEQDGKAYPSPFMLMSAWSQKGPYNAHCPQTDGEPMAAGCGAIAMAQILNYYKQPATAHGQATYHYSYSGVERDIEADFDKHPFDWANIRNTYDESSTDEERQAVANLVYMTGAAMHLMWSVTGGTSTTNYGTFMWGLQHYMGISPTARFIHRQYYSTDEWIAMIDEQLAQHHPVFYNAAHTDPFGKKSGHFFVIDGRDSQGNYHFNFGHDSSQQDKFTNLNACNQGTKPMPGNIYACYHYSQGMMINCYPTDNQTASDLPRCEAALYRPFVLEDQPDAHELSVAKRVRAKFSYRCISFEPDSIQYSIGFYRNGELAAVSPSWRTNNISIGGGVSNIDRYFLLPEGMDNGSYEMAFVTRDCNTAAWRRGWDDAPNSVPVNVNGDTFTFFMPDYHNGPTNLSLVDDVKEIPDVQQGGHTVEFTISNPSTNNFCDTLRLCIDNGTDTQTWFMPTSIYDHQELTYHIFIPDNDNNYDSDFALRLYYKDTCSDKWKALSDMGTGIENISAATEHTSIHKTGIFTLDGTLIRRYSSANSLTGLPQGAYIVRLPDDTVRKIWVK